MTLVWDIAFPTQSQKLIALKLADYASDSGCSVYPSNESLAKRSGCDERTVQRTLKAFRNCGVISLVRQGGTGPRATNEWLLNVEVIAQLASGQMVLSGSAQDLEINDYEPIENKDDSMGDSVSPATLLRVTSDPLRVTPVSSKGDSIVSPDSSRTTILEPSTRAHAREGSQFGFGSEGKKNQASFTITPRDGSCWNEWLAFCSSKGRGDIAYDARQRGAIRTTSRYPTPDSPLPALASKGRAA